MCNYKDNKSKKILTKPVYVQKFHVNIATYIMQIPSEEHVIVINTKQVTKKLMKQVSNTAS